jgi:hypothetical protein
LKFRSHAQFSGAAAQMIQTRDDGEYLIRKGRKEDQPERAHEILSCQKDDAAQDKKRSEGAAWAHRFFQNKLGENGFQNKGGRRRGDGKTQRGGLYQSHKCEERHCHEYYRKEQITPLEDQKDHPLSFIS